MHDLRGNPKDYLNKPQLTEPQHSWSLMHPHNCILTVQSASQIGGWAFVLFWFYPSGMHFSKSTVYLRPWSGCGPRNVRSESAWSYQILANRQWSFWFCKIKAWTSWTLRRVFQLEDSVILWFHPTFHIHPQTRKIWSELVVLKPHDSIKYQENVVIPGIFKLCVFHYYQVLPKCWTEARFQGL